MSKKNKPNKIKVVIDRPPMLEPGLYQADTVDVKSINNELTIVIKVKQDDKY
jgi:hypothetical protein